MKSSHARQTSARFHWSRKLLLLLLLILASALALTMLLRRNINAPVVLFNAFSDAALGLVAGMGSRFVFRSRHWILRLVTATLLCLIGLLLLGQLTGGVSGVGPVRLHPVNFDWLARLGLSARIALPIGFGLDWSRELADVLLALSIALLALRAWNGRQRANPVSAPGKRRVPAATETYDAPPSLSPRASELSAPARAAPRPNQPSAPPQRAPSRIRPLGLPPALAALGGGPGTTVQPRRAALRTPPARAGQRSAPKKSSAQRAGMLIVRRPAPTSGGARTRGRVRQRTTLIRAPRRSGGANSSPRNLLRRRRAVRLAVYEEHRCPYCLEPVQRGDPRGTMECPICHTLHHKDCWDITGSCQIPHLTS